MSQPATEQPAATAGGGKKILGMNRQTVIVFGVALVGAMAYILYKRGKSSTAAAPGTQTGATGECTDANGNPTPCEDMAGIDYSGELSTIQTEVETIAGQGTATTTTTGTGTTTATAPSQVNQYPAVSFTAKKTTATAILVQFKALTSPTPVPPSYTVEAWQLNGKIAGVQTLSAPDSTGGVGQVTVSGLTPKFCYNIKVWANGGKVAPTGTPTKVCL